MEKLKNKTDKIISSIYEYQKYIKLNKQFINALEEEGGDTSNLRKEIDDLEKKIDELKVIGGLSSWQSYLYFWFPTLSIKQVLIDQVPVLLYPSQ